TGSVLVRKADFPYYCLHDVFPPPLQNVGGAIQDGAAFMGRQPVGPERPLCGSDSLPDLLPRGQAEMSIRLQRIFVVDRHGGLAVIPLTVYQQLSQGKVW